MRSPDDQDAGLEPRCPDDAGPQTYPLSPAGREHLKRIFNIYFMHMASKETARRKRIAALAQVRSGHVWIVDLPPDQSVPAQRTMLHVDRTFRFVSLLVPKRLANEEIGDALEVITEHFKRSPKRWPVYLKLVTTIFWIAVNTIRYLLASLKGSKAEGTKKTSGE